MVLENLALLLRFTLLGVFGRGSFFLEPSLLRFWGFNFFLYFCLGFIVYFCVGFIPPRSVLRCLLCCLLSCCLLSCLLPLNSLCSDFRRRNIVGSKKVS
jgi:hypothetical protein